MRSFSTTPEPNNEQDEQSEKSKPTEEPKKKQKMKKPERPNLFLHTLFGFGVLAFAVSSIFSNAGQ